MTGYDVYDQRLDWLFWAESWVDTSQPRRDGASKVRAHLAEHGGTVLVVESATNVALAAYGCKPRLLLDRWPSAGVVRGAA